MLINFVDFKKAFDSIHRESLWKIMKSYGIPQRIIDIIRNFYNGSKCAAKHGGEVRKWFQIITGVRQGYFLSPLIFALVVDWVMTRLMSGKNTVIKWVNGDRLGDLDFADDIALLENSWKGMKDLTDRTQKEAAKEADSSCDRKIKVRIGRANATFGRLDKILKKNGCSTTTKIRLHNVMVVSTLLYGSETWPITVANRKRLEAAHHRRLRRILHVSWPDKITNKSIRERTGQEDIENIVRKRRLRWLSTCGAWTRIEEPTRYCIGYMGEEREKE